MECHICYERFDSKNFVPKILIQCGHSFCKICVERISNKKSTIQCPICRENTKIGKREFLPTNYALCETIEKSFDVVTKNVLEKYKFFDDKLYKNVSSDVVRNFEPKKLILKKIINNDFIYIEEFESGQNISFFNNMSKRNRRYNFNRNSNFAYFFNEYSYSIWVYRKASKCKHSYSCLEYIFKNAFFSTCVGLLSKYPLKILFNFLFDKLTKGGSSNVGNIESINKYVLMSQWILGSFLSSSKILKCIVGFYLDEILKMK